jgi:ribokinase
MAMRQASVVVVGSSNTDMVVRSKHLPSPGETVLGGEFSQFPGGKGANQAVAAARAGARVTFIGRVGDDPLGHAAIRNLEKAGVITDAIHRDKETPSAVALILVDERGENLISAAPGANARLSTDDIDRSLGIIRSADVVLLQLEIPLDTVYHTIEVAHAAGRTIILNPAPAPQEPIPAEILAKVSILVPNEIELAMMAIHPVRSEAEAEAAARILLGKGVSTVVVTRGNRGPLIVTSDRAIPIAALPVEPADTVTTGDRFVGVLAAAVAEGKTLEEACRFAAVYV